MRLLKLMAYALLGYVIYELYRGMTEEPVTRASRRGERVGSKDLRRALNEDPGRMNITGPGRGTTVSTEDAVGASSPHVVGRGVTGQS